MAARKNRLDSTLLDRFAQRPAWVGSVKVRRIAAGILVAVAVLLFVDDAAGDDRVRVVTAGRDLMPGTILTAADVAVAEWDSATVPDGAVLDSVDVDGRTLTGPVRAGELLTDVRLLGSRTATAAVGVEARVVPVHLADAGVTDLLREGDRVDVLTVETQENPDAPPAARILASGAMVVLVSAEAGGGRQRDRVVLLALPTEDATTVAAASLVSALTVTLH
ncbi:RcpC/CpaB family pilus assembly protein [Rhodococcus fascians]|jgi:Flp pilus assembly protein CpaB|uniref:RcpC/CpaB family pilus assembly protein n=1 Tax=Rhodococcoides fascians TaxID=1828 RepID=UPI0024BA7F90|nr:RcpC/CpaB family pilus assembly protein [Rhodococcus fascians]MDJ0428943.1 RcpC/CpaB family pilus assembly protein [Rhodococcus fascians]MDJ0469101.1 RcpC/CpaB family pilus assembly protein [Rhodococcus fascians]